ncbi:hypothetical protein ACA910_014361 [Epithemia clementina (nom. ined.)]
MPVYHKPTDKPTEKPVETKPTNPTLLCRNSEYEIVQLWTGPVLAADGEKVELSEANPYVPVGMGVQFPYVGNVYEEINGYEVGYSVEKCTRLDEDDIWLCEGTLINLYECSGHLAFSGIYSDVHRKGEYVITGGTGDHNGAVGVIYDEFDADTKYTMRKIKIH